MKPVVDIETNQSGLGGVENTANFILRYSHLPKKWTGLDKRAGVQFDQKLVNKQDSKVPNNRAGMHILSNNDK